MPNNWKLTVEVLGSVGRSFASTHSTPMASSMSLAPVETLPALLCQLLLHMQCLPSETDYDGPFLLQRLARLGSLAGLPQRCLVLLHVSEGVRPREVKERVGDPAPQERQASQAEGLSGANS